MIEKNRNYTVNELKQLFGDNWITELNLVSPPACLYKKPVINSFNEFDEETKQIYINIYNIIKDKNQNKDITVWATGSRVKGNWRTKEEAEEIAQTYNRKVKYSDYDYYTTAFTIPTKEYFFQQLGIAVDHVGGESHKVIVEF